jgi:hypothetical protein
MPDNVWITAHRRKLRQYLITRGGLRYANIPDSAVSRFGNA